MDIKRVDLNEVASILDEHIEKALQKSLSFNPHVLHEMTDDSPFYNPYRRMEDGSFAPHEKGYWVSQGKNADGYRETDKFYQTTSLDNVGVSFKRSMGDEIEIIKKAVPMAKPMAKPAPMMGSQSGTTAKIGEVRQHADGTKWRKVRENMGLRNWELVSAPKGHALEQEAKTQGHAQDKTSQVEKIREEIKKKKTHVDQEKSSKKQTIQTVRDAFKDHKDEKFHQRLDQMEKDIDIPKELQDKVQRRPKGKGVEVHLNEEELGALLNNGKFGMISAGKNPNLEKDMTPEEEHQRYEKLRKELVERGYTFTRITGHYGGLEDSFLVMAHDIDKEDLRLLGHELNQDSVMFGDKGQQELHFTTGDNAGKMMAGKGWEESPEKQDMYSSLKTKNGEFKFSLNIDDKDLKEHKPDKKAGVNSTADMYKTKDGKYILERKKIHDKIIKDRLDKIIPSSNPIAIFTGGGSGSGKTGVLDQAMKIHGKDLVHIDADNIKNDIPEYKEMIKKGDGKAAAFSHEESADLTMELIHRAIESNKPFVFDSTMKSPDKFKKIIKKLKDSGFRSHIFFADVPLEVAKERAAKRAEKTARVVPDHIIEDSHKGAIKSLGILAPLVDSTSVYTTEGDPPPRFVYGRRDGQTIKDSSYHKKMLERGHVLKSEIESESSLFDNFLKTISGLKSYTDKDDSVENLPENVNDRIEYESDKAGNEK